ncbi:MAG: LPS export ABC transporter permease LptG [Gemmobacter sp.]|nr:LPS export ABC transporter permease LptG [Gemmobacter sp.]
MTLGLYFARRFLVYVGLVVAVFAGILMLIDMVEEIRRNAGRDLGLAQAAQLAALNLPGGIYRILPLVIMLAAVALFLALSRSSELVVTRAVGRSALRAVVAPVIVALGIGLFAVAVINPLVAATARVHDKVSAELVRGTDSVLSISREGLWLRQGGEDGQTVIRAARANQEGTHLIEATFLTIDASGLPVTRIEAAEARLQPGHWVLTKAKQWRFDSENPELDAKLLESAQLATDLTANKIRESFGAPSSVAIWELPEFIRSLDQAGFSSQKHRVWLQMELALPLLLMAMVLLASGFTMRHVRFGRTGTMVLLAILAGFAIFFLRNIAQVLGESGQIPVFLAAWSPPMVALMLSVALLLHLEDG